MAKCTDCVHHELCYMVEHYGRDLETDMACKRFMDKDGFAKVVKCKDCTYYKANNGICSNPLCTTSFFGCPVKEEHYCSYGKRKEN